jgi:hypothetical protein
MSHFEALATPKVARMLRPLVLLALLSSACSAPGGAKSPEPTTETVTSADGAGAEELPAEELAGEELADVDAAARAFDAAERSLGGSFALEERGRADVDAEEAEAMDKTGTPSPSQQPPAGSTSLAADHCPRACRALGSMRRSAERLCELTGRNDPRCHNVEQRFDRARDTVRRSCPACAL